MSDLDPARANLAAESTSVRPARPLSGRKRRLGVRAGVAVALACGLAVGSYGIASAASGSSAPRRLSRAGRDLDTLEDISRFPPCAAGDLRASWALDWVRIVAVRGRWNDHRARRDDNHRRDGARWHPHGHDRQLDDLPRG